MFIDYFKFFISKNLFVDSGLFFFCNFIRAADWNLGEPTWTGRMRLVAKGIVCHLKLEDKTSGALFANCPIDTYPGVAIEAVSDSSRYFVIRVQDDNGTCFQKNLSTLSFPLL